MPGEFPTLPWRALDDVLTRWQNEDGSFRSRRLLVGWNNVPYLRWGHAQLFRSLCILLLVTSSTSEE